MRVLLLLALAMHLLMGPARAATGAPAPSAAVTNMVALSAAGSVDLLPAAALLIDRGGDFPQLNDAAALAAWQAGQERAASVAATGGAYWMVIAVRNDSKVDDWVLYPNNTMIDQVEARLFGDDGSSQRVVTGYRSDHAYMLHYSGELRLLPGRSYRMVVRFSSPYYVRAPLFAVYPHERFRRLVARENVVVLGSLGALVALALYNFFIYSFTRRSAYLYYSLYVITSAVAWALPFNVLVDMFGWRLVKLHYVPFFLLPVFSTLFYIRFLELRTLAPRLAAISRINIVVPLLLLPTSFLAVGVAHRLATVMLAFYMVLALICGIVAWRRGFKPARYFVLAYIAVLSPGLVVLAANMGLVPAADINMPLLVLVGGTVDALLLAFALADQIRLLSNRMEQQVAARTDDLLKANVALTTAKEHAEVVSRHRIDFLSAMSHDIRTPMAGVIGMLKLALRDPAVRGRTADYLRIGLRSGESLLVILNDILDYSKIDAGKLTLETTTFDLDRLTADAVAILRGQAEAKGLALRTAFEEGLPRFVEGDPTRIRQILVNLLGNAIKFTEHGEVLLTVRAGPPADGQAQAPLVFSIHDTGPGIAPDVQQRLFQKFEQGDYSTTRRYGGTGLGLAICKELASLMGGAISVASTPGVGSRFDVVLPLQAAPAPAGADTDPGVGEAPPLADGSAHGRRLRILCAEDVATNQIIIKALLGAMGHQVAIVDNGVAALRALATEDFDMVLMDGRMPVLDGAQATRLIRAGQGLPGDATTPAVAPARNPAIPIIALTANASQADCQHYLAAGMDGFLTKPVDDAALHRVIAATIARLGGAGPGTADQGTDGSGGDDTAALTTAAADTDDSGPVHLAPVRGLSPEHMRRIAFAFIDEAPRRLLEAREALAAGRQSAAMDAFHSLKGSAGYLSSPRLQELAGRLEQRAGAGPLPVHDPELAALADALDEAVHGLRLTTAADPIL